MAQQNTDRMMETGIPYGVLFCFGAWALRFAAMTHSSREPSLAASLKSKRSGRGRFQDPNLESKWFACSRKKVLPREKTIPEIRDVANNGTVRITLLVCSTSVTLQSLHLFSFCCSKGSVWSIIAALSKPLSFDKSRFKNYYIHKQHKS